MSTSIEAITIVGVPQRWGDYFEEHADGRRVRERFRNLEPFTELGDHVLDEDDYDQFEAFHEDDGLNGLEAIWGGDEAGYVLGLRLGRTPAIYHLRDAADSSPVDDVSAKMTLVQTKLLELGIEEPPRLFTVLVTC